MKNHSKVPIQSYSFRSIYSRVRTKITQSYSFCSIYPRVRTKITPNQIHIYNIQSNTKNLKGCPKISTGETKRRERASTHMHRLPQCHRGNPQVECQNIYQVNQYDTPLSPRVFNCKTYIKCSQIHKNIPSNNSVISKGKLNSSQQDREGETPYDLTILTKLAIHQDRAKSRTQKREMGQTHS